MHRCSVFRRTFALEKQTILHIVNRKCRETQEIQAILTLELSKIGYVCEAGRCS